MMITAVISTTEAGRYRITAGGIVSMPLTVLTHVGELNTGDMVLCWFNSGSLAEGVIIGKVVA